jgi:nucleotide-binding universal stress UspA family protein
LLPFKRIVCPTDFSEASDRALKAAVELARRFSSELLIVHVVQPVPLIAGAPQVPGNVDLAVYERELEANSKKALEQVRKRRVPKDLRARTILGFGAPADAIVDIAAKERADLIIIATHGLAGWRRFVFGSVAEKVVRLASHAVLVIQAPSGKALKPGGANAAVPGA